ncbi:hypothetical protein ACEQPO_09475 [Bacillus sp. SL00103]
MAENILGAGLIKEDVHVEPYAVCRAFLASKASCNGAEVKECTPVIEVKREKEALAIRTTLGTFTCDDLTIASGVVWPFLKSLDYLILFISKRRMCLYGIRVQHSNTPFTMIIVTSFNEIAANWSLAQR